MRHAILLDRIEPVRPIPDRLPGRVRRDRPQRLDRAVRGIRNESFQSATILLAVLALTPGIVHHTSHISRITHHTSHITHRTFHIPHHTSHITHHPSHITHQKSQNRPHSSPLSFTSLTRETPRSLRHAPFPALTSQPVEQPPRHLRHQPDIRARRGHPDVELPRPLPPHRVRPAGPALLVLGRRVDADYRCGRGGEWVDDVVSGASPLRISARAHSCDVGRLRLSIVT